jgi:hypothetical protein
MNTISFYKSQTPVAAFIARHLFDLALFQNNLVFAAPWFGAEDARLRREKQTGQPRSEEHGSPAESVGSETAVLI